LRRSRLERRRPTGFTCLGERRFLALAGLALAGASLLPTTEAHAQIPFTAVGLGYPIRSIDARSIALGGVTNGLLGGSFSLGNPADVTLHSSAAVAVAVAGENVDLTSPSATQNTGRSWFPVIGAVVPLGDWAVRVGFGGLLDQDMRIIVTDTLDSSLGRFEFEEQRTRDGGLSQIDVSIGRKLGPVGVGVGIQRLTGSLQQSFRRRFTEDIDGSGFLPGGVVQASETDYRGWSVKAGLNAELYDRFVLSGAYFFATDLTAERLQSPLEREFRLPSGFEGGASGLITNRFFVAVGGGWSGWSQTEPDPGSFGTADVSWLGGGLAYSVFFGSIPVAIRAGARTRDLPFILPEFEQSKEQAITFGLGVVLGGRARIDLGFEFGSRGDLETTGTEESFTGLNFTASLVQ
jgi:hypothetical protein